MGYASKRDAADTFGEGLMTEPENLVLTLPREMRAEISDMGFRMATKSDVDDLRREMTETTVGLCSEVTSPRAGVASDMLLLEKRLSGRIGHLNHAVMQ